MIKLLRNTEIKKALILQMFFSACMCGLSFLWDVRFGIFTVALCTFFIVVYCISTYKRYKLISEFAADVNKILHGDNQIGFERYSEGELSILQSEVYKMTVRLRDQKQALLEDKIYLADSLADISHQIRTPLTSINLLVSLISKPDISNEKKEKLSYDLYELISHIEYLITTLLKISKLDAGTITFTKEEIKLSKLVEESTAALLIPMELRNIKLKMSCQGNFIGDIVWTREAITNIVKNCMEHTFEDGEIEIIAKDTSLFTEIIIKDNGSGIAKEDLPHIFERFYKGRNSSNNSFGIGLALARMIVTCQNGTIKAENRKSRGAKFTLRFYKGAV